ncbi:DUF5340 domain-containing protein [Spirulina major CS-329]|uniref:DUF5340 domain-containing protein n=1 Tax=Spirulina TaxID=1154 RepID=UPI00232D54B2|nr:MULTISPECIES: DUF5340 domain-containing protein [Spirulina]MDB9493240.1 DUF5340 domain-containing protein [Spirulina subsalsa CS-330]MDB9503334.1 DUF5340 domain-containing protein [Spirulina major CS-329]
MDQIPLPSLVHYELLLQLLERQSIHAVDHNSALREQIQQLIITIRKALAQQRQIETICNQANIDYEHRWSLNSVGAMANDDDALPQVFQSLEQ